MTIRCLKQSIVIPVYEHYGKRTLKQVICIQPETLNKSGNLETIAWSIYMNRKHSLGKLNLWNTR